MRKPNQQLLTRREFAALSGGALLAACSGDLDPVGPLQPLADGLTVNTVASDDRLTGTAQLIEKPLGSGKWRLTNE
jgi:hypothetical protein